MNKLVIIAVFIFWGAVSIFYANSLFQPAKNLNNSASNQKNSNAQINTLGSELSLHNSKSDCWLAINDKIYNVTDYIYSHPGGAGEIIKYCGQDATKAFASKDKLIPQDHSAQAYAMLAAYYIGDMASTSTTNTNIQTATSTESSSTNPAPSDTKTTTQPVSYTLTTALVAQHSTPVDCWVTSGSSVYNVTSYIRSHPGGQSAITSYCGKDIAAAFAAQGHSANASNIFASYKIGTIGSSVSNTSATTPPATTNTNTTGTRGYDDEEDD